MLRTALRCSSSSGSSGSSSSSPTGQPLGSPSRLAEEEALLCSCCRASKAQAAEEALLCSCCRASEAQAAEEARLPARPTALGRSWAAGGGRLRCSAAGAGLLASSAQRAGGTQQARPTPAPPCAAAPHAERSATATGSAASCGGAAARGARNCVVAAQEPASLQPQPSGPDVAAAAAAGPMLGLLLRRPGTPGHQQAASGTPCREQRPSLWSPGPPPAAPAQPAGGAAPALLPAPPLALHRGRSTASAPEGGARSAGSACSRGCGGRAGGVGRARLSSWLGSRRPRAAARSRCGA
jgi:hypothetical protein